MKKILGLQAPMELASTRIKWDYDTDDQLKFALHEEMRSLMVEEWDEDVQSNKEDP